MSAKLPPHTDAIEEEPTDTQKTDSEHVHTDG